MCMLKLLLVLLLDLLLSPSVAYGDSLIPKDLPVGEICNLGDCAKGLRCATLAYDFEYQRIRSETFDLRFCTKDCKTSEDCDDDGICVDFPKTSKCFKRCEKREDCGSGPYVCTKFGDQGACVPAPFPGLLPFDMELSFVGIPKVDQIRIIVVVGGEVVVDRTLSDGSRVLKYYTGVFHWSPNVGPVKVYVFGRGPQGLRLIFRDDITEMFTRVYLFGATRPKKFTYPSSDSLPTSEILFRVSLRS